MACRFNRSRAGWFALLALPLAQAVAAPPPNDFFGHPQVSKATLSPHGTQLAYLYTQANGRQGIAVRDTRNPEQLTVVAASQSEDAPIDELSPRVGPIPVASPSWATAMAVMPH